MHTHTQTDMSRPRALRVALAVVLRLWAGSQNTGLCWGLQITVIYYVTLGRSFHLSEAQGS